MWRPGMHVQLTEFGRDLLQFQFMAAQTLQRSGLPGGCPLLNRCIRLNFNSVKTEGSSTLFSQYRFLGGAQGVSEQMEILISPLVVQFHLGTWCLRATWILQLNPAMSNSVISNSPLSRTEQDFPWICPCFFSHLLWAISNSVVSNTPLSRTVFRFPYSQINPGYIELYCIPKKHWSISVGKCSQGTSWQDALKAEKCIDVFTVTKAKLDWPDTVNAEGDKNFRDQTITPEIGHQPRHLEHPLSRTISRYPWEFEIAGFYCSLHSAVSDYSLTGRLRERPAKDQFPHRQHINSCFPFASKYPWVTCSLVQVGKTRERKCWRYGIWSQAGFWPLSSF